MLLPKEPIAICNRAVACPGVCIKHNRPTVYYTDMSRGMWTLRDRYKLYGELAYNVYLSSMIHPSIHHIFNE